ncbi:acyl-CoA dehydrogenase family protein [Streptomyces griseofuscus]|uniref:acyl-CoA dehydrogenase family protein n=1 Tax=Streptomyces griseofuscus TaxID=146922 RepID=UPI0036BBA9C1
MGEWEQEVRRRIAELERAFGDPADADNPVGAAAFLAADARAEPLAAAERLLERCALNAELVPRDLGGRLTGLDTLARVIRVVFRRDAALALGHGVTSFLAAVVIWAAGSPAQRRAVARLLLSGGHLVSAYPELAAGSSFLSNELTATVGEGPESCRLSGRKAALNNVARADSLVLFARTGTGRLSHSALLVERDALPAGGITALPRHRTLGIRGCQVAGIEFNDCPVPAQALVGEPGRGLELVLRIFAVSRSVGPSAALGCADTALRTAVACAVDRGAVGADSDSDGPQRLSHARSTLAGAFVDLLLCDGLALVATRAVHLFPEDAGLYAAAVKYLMPQLLTDTAYELSTLLGADFHARDGAYAAFRKNVRDLPVIGLGAAGSAACRATVTPQLPRLARTAWCATAAAPADGLFRLDADGLPPLDLDRLSPAAGGDPLAASLMLAAGAPWPGSDRLAELVRLLAGELALLRDGCTGLDREGRSALADPRGHALAERYGLILAGAACLGVWRRQRTADTGFLARPDWLEAALIRVLRRLGTALPKIPPDHDEPLLAEVLARYREHRSFDLYDTPLAGAPGTHRARREGQEGREGRGE